MKKSEFFIPDFHEKLLAWYHCHKRDLPWRKTKDPYKIWISEIMLQQTQVKAVIDYYHRFLTRFPTLEDLAQAEEKEVLALWSGLGYYSRGRNIHKAAQAIVQNHDAIFPKEPRQIEALPGIGKYTLGAIASIAFDQPLALVDGNVIRVYARLFALKGAPNDGKFQKGIWKIAEKLLDKNSPGDFNQALMELGATVCTPKNPICLLCPLQQHCKGRTEGPENFPAKKKKAAPVKLHRLVALIFKKEKILLEWDPHQRWFKNLWTLPGCWLESEPSDKEPLLLERLGKKGIKATHLRALDLHRHQITHHAIMLHPYLADCRKGFIPDVQNLEGAKYEWTPLEKLADYPLPANDKKLIQKAKLLVDSKNQNQ